MTNAARAARWPRRACPKGLDWHAHDRPRLTGWLGCSRGDPALQRVTLILTRLPPGHSADKDDDLSLCFPSEKEIAAARHRAIPRSVKINRVSMGDSWWPGTELNRRHHDFQSCALPTELPGRVGVQGIIALTARVTPSRCTDCRVRQQFQALLYSLVLTLGAQLRLIRRIPSITRSFERVRSLKRIDTDMLAHAESLSLPHRPVRRLFGPVFVWTFLTTVLATLRQQALRPSMPRMSADWLMSHEKEFYRLDY